MSREKEIVKLMEKRGNEIVDYEYKDLASEIEKLFEVEGETKIDYVLQKHVDMYGWTDSSSGWKKEVALKKIKEGEIRAIKRITIDQIIEEAK